MAGVIQALGGLGLFLLGMSIMTEGLRALADDRLRGLLARSTKSPLSGVCTGAFATALVQSSSATTVAAVGFVHAGLLTFSEALGIIFGANIGTTITGWLVAFVGFKLKLGEIVLPIIFAGVMMRLGGRAGMKSLGTAIAGFGLIFVGLATLQDGMSAFRGDVTPDAFPSDTIGGRLLLVLIGAVITLITQSSSAGVATALAAVNVGTISLHQAAAMVIGMDFGTTVTAAMATIGGNVQARRTGFAHVIYNALTAVMAFTLLTPYMVCLDWLLPGASVTDAELSLVGFHTFFNGIGVLAILPFTRHFASFIEGTFPERGNALARRLDKSLQKSSESALQAVSFTLHELVGIVCRELTARLKQPREAPNESAHADLEDAMKQTRDYLQDIRVDVDGTARFERYESCLHILDHLRRMLRRLHRHHVVKLTRDDEELAAMADELIAVAELLVASDLPTSEEAQNRAHQTNAELTSRMRRYRVHTLSQTGKRQLEHKTALHRLDTARWIRRMAHHVWRIAKHGGGLHLQ